jgi:hypothetical protein
VALYVSTKRNRTPPSARRMGEARPLGKPGDALPQDPGSASLAPVNALGECRAVPTNPVSADGRASSEAVALTHELIEALTATGNYLGAATRLLSLEAPPPGNAIREVFEKSLTQFTRAVDAVRHLQAAIGPGDRISDPPREHD